MAKLSSTLLTPIRGTASSLIKWMMERGFSKSKIIARAKQVFRRFKDTTIDAIYLHWKEQKNVATKLSKGKGTEDIGVALSPSSKGLKRNIRVDVNVDINLGEYDIERSGKFTFDFEGIGTYSDVFDAIRERLAFWLSDFYGIKQGQLFGIGKAIEAIEILSVQTL